MMILKSLLLLFCLVFYARACPASRSSCRRSWHKPMGWCNDRGSQLFTGDFNGDGKTDMLCHDSAGKKSIAFANSAGHFTRNSWSKYMGWCYHAGAELHLGDFNGDGRTDMLCHDSAGKKWVALANSAGHFSGTSWYNDMGWCSHGGAELHLGDFNGDGRTDMLCHDSAGKKWVAFANSAGQFNGTSWYKAMGWCSNGRAELHVGDFNGDGKADMLCHDSAGKKSIAFANGEGHFTGNSWYNDMGWCNHTGAELHVGDFNGDGRTDMLCHDSAGKKWVALADSAGQFNGTFWSKAMGWCYHAGAELHVGDFNGDGRTDMLCHDSAGKKWISLVNSDGQFTGNSWYRAMGWCSHVGAELHVGDFNGDGKADMLCHDSDGKKWIAFANGEGHFTGNSWYKAMGWCNHTGAVLHVGDFNGDGRTDMLCHDSTGKKWVALADSAGQFAGTTWYSAMGWCYHAWAKLKVGDFNGDGRDDMLCYDGTRMWISLANRNGSFPGNSWQKDITWCHRRRNGATVYVGDFNNDTRDDLLCHDNAGRGSVMLAQPGGSFTGRNDWYSKRTRCAGKAIYVGDMNGDNRADMVCKNRTSGETDIRFAGRRVKRLFTARAESGLTRQCSGQNKTLFLADIDGDNKKDMLCHDKSTGEKWIDYSCFL